MHTRNILEWGGISFFLLFTVSVWATDTTPPSVPTFSAADVGTTSVTLYWNTSTDDVGVTGYEVFKNGTSVGTTTYTWMGISSLAQATGYTFTVRARDAAGNWSAQCAATTLQTKFRLFSASGCLSSTDNYDEDNNYIGTDYSIDYYSFTAASAGSVWIYATNGVTCGPDGTGDARASVDGAGSYDFTVTGGSGSYQVFVDYRVSSAPSVSFTTSVTSGRAPLAVSFDSSGSSCTETVIAYEWDLENNGTIDTTMGNVSHTYNNTGSSAITYYPKLTMTNLEGETGTNVHMIAVYPAGSYKITVQHGTSSLPYQMSGSTVTLTANTPTGGQQFYSWSIISGSGTFANASSTTTTFTMGSADTVVEAFGPSAPASLTSTGHTYNTVGLSWEAASGSFVGYDVYRTRGGATNLVGSTSPSTLTFTDINVLSAASYSYYVKARDSSGTSSAPSNTVTVTTDAIADADGDGVPDSLEIVLNIQSNSNPSSDSNLNLKSHSPRP